MAWALIFAVAKRTGIEDRGIRAGAWQTGFPSRSRKTLGLLGAATSAARWSGREGIGMTSSRGPNLTRSDVQSST